MAIGYTPLFVVAVLAIVIPIYSDEYRQERQLGSLRVLQNAILNSGTAYRIPPFTAYKKKKKKDKNGNKKNKDKNGNKKNKDKNGNKKNKAIDDGASDGASKIADENDGDGNNDATTCSTMSPPSPLAPDDSNCWKWWDAFEDGKLMQNPPPIQKGCDYAPCKAAVCECDSYCCKTAWDLSCRGYELEPGDTTSSNYFSNGCSARLLCCEQETSFPKPPMVISNSPSTTCVPGEEDCCATMKPPSVIAPDDSTCWQWWDAFFDGEISPDAPPPTKGCDYEPCQEAVCECDDYCCRIAWDLSCRGYELEPGDTGTTNSFVEGCSARLLCCEQDSAFPKPLQLTNVTTSSTNFPTAIVGGDTDSYDCIASEGYSWCDSLQECIRPWETECNTALPGGDEDSYGCIPSAGYTWCEPLQECIRPWETECNTTLPGGDKDSYDCIASAGYTWCDSLQECIRPWETECNTALPGGDKDSYGCIPSAGYTWCEPLQECIRPWEIECNTTLPGGDKDSYGCIASAGYTWCEPLQECIRPWETTCDIAETSEEPSPSPIISLTESPTFLKSIPISNVPIQLPTVPASPSIIIVSPATTSSPTLPGDVEALLPASNICSTMIPPSELAPDDSTCWQWYDPNNQNKPLTTGCDYKPCEDAVCACDSYCCEIAWDLSCRGYSSDSSNYYVEGCSASLLCCEQDDSFPKPPVGVAYSSMIRQYKYSFP